jgi:hypothetical protein
VRENKDGKFDFILVVLLEAATRTMSWKRVGGEDKVHIVGCDSRQFHVPTTFAPRSGTTNIRARNRAQLSLLLDTPLLVWQCLQLNVVTEKGK